MDKPNVMTQEMWNGLSAADKALLKQLGVTVEKVKKQKTVNPITLERVRATRTTCPEEEYWLELTKVCDCCGTVEIVTGKMCRKRPMHSYLSLDKMVIPEGESYKRRRVAEISCDCCIDVLQKKSTEELAKMLVNLHRMFAKGKVL